MQKRLFLIILVFLLSVILVLASPIPSQEEQKITCTDRIATSEDRDIRKGLMTSPLTTNLLGTCVPLSASLSSWWFKTNCGVPFKYEINNNIHEKLSFYMDTGAFRGTHWGNAYFGLKRFLEEDLPGCFSITVISCSGSMFARVRPKFNWLDPSTWTHPKRLINPFSWFRDYEFIDFSFSEGGTFNVGDNFIPRCPTKQDVIDLLLQNGDVLLGLHNKEISHAIAVDGVSGNNILINSNGLPAKLIVNKEDPLNVDYVDVENFLDNLRGAIGNTKNADVPFLMAVIPNKDCKIKCPPVDYVNIKDPTDIYKELQKNTPDPTTHIPEEAGLIYWNTEEETCPIKVNSINPKIY